ncbi:hypothetical protein K469DRAFT_292622 [Zopfia rhizophila CBS 207.26]|uniref:Uncharacterized protein n=1 Tax=Zopfia rhizophila CBS 207.26 TaxID=1314779 RepID=A0A6A6DKE8_9PEZI|nr:hypothetical protein K469DRAFT_292622 [Zopfia rhizophila CBS 207.26]
MICRHTLVNRDGMNITVGGAHEPAKTVFASRRVRAICQFLHVLPDGASLPDTHIKTFQCTLHYLDGDEDLRYLRSDPHVLLLLVHTWMMAGEMALPNLQNCIINFHRRTYKRIRGARVIPDSEYPLDDIRPSIPDANVPRAFRHLEKHFGEKCASKRFLISFVVGLADDPKGPKRQMYRERLRDRIIDAIIEGTKLSRRDPIIHDIHRFKDSTSIHRGTTHRGLCYRLIVHGLPAFLAHNKMSELQCPQRSHSPSSSICYTQSTAESRDNSRRFLLRFSGDGRA